MIISRQSNLDRNNKHCPQLEIPESQLRKLCMAARDVIMAQPMLPELSAPVNICGDIHGLSHPIHVYLYLSCTSLVILKEFQFSS